MNAYFPELSFHYIIGQHNINELTQFVELAHSLRVNHIFFTALLHSFDEIRDLLVSDKKELEQRIDDARMKGLELGILVDHNLDTQEHRPPVRRCNAWIQPFIFSDGTVIACCAQNESNRRDFQKLHSFGNVFEESFRDIWFGEKYVRFRRAIRTREVPAVCRDCPVYDAEAS
jgi:MoaA/NifB/PqqE/SkfB family radical SAM enzyme